MRVAVFITGLISGLSLSDWSFTLKITNEQLVQRNLILGLYAVASPFIFVVLIALATILDVLNSLGLHNSG